ncbi:MAG: hypothetical protein IPL61_27855 [Myxococcales bacterium]|nr:hypothetical protein [Myxococcales bacterium]
MPASSLCLHRAAGRAQIGAATSSVGRAVRTAAPSLGLHRAAGRAQIGSHLRPPGLLVAVGLALTACAPVDGPTLAEVVPAAARAGATITLTGADLCGPTVDVVAGACEPLPSGAVDFGLTPPIVRAEVVAWRAGSIAVVVPSQVAIGPTTVYVTVDGRSSNGLSFEVLP